MGNLLCRRPLAAKTYISSPQERIAMSEYWLISAPGDKTCQQTWETMNNITFKQNNLSVNYKFAIPDLKVLHNFSYNKSV